MEAWYLEDIQAIQNTSSGLGRQTPQVVYPWPAFVWEGTSWGLPSLGVGQSALLCLPSLTLAPCCYSSSWAQHTPTGPLRFTISRGGGAEEREASTEPLAEEKEAFSKSDRRGHWVS